MKHDFATRARECVGARFRPQGRDPRWGLDCIGLAATTYSLPLARVRSDYGLRGKSQAEMERELEQFFLRISPTEAEAGDLLLVQPGPKQLHVLILKAEGYIHADAGLRRVVEVPGAVPWPVLSAWRYLED